MASPLFGRCLPDSATQRGAEDPDVSAKAILPPCLGGAVGLDQVPRCSDTGLLRLDAGPGQLHHCQAGRAFQNGYASCSLHRGQITVPNYRPLAAVSWRAVAGLFHCPTGEIRLTVAARQCS